MLASRWLFLSAIVLMLLPGCGDGPASPTSDSGVVPELDVPVGMDVARPRDVSVPEVSCAVSACGVGLTCCALTGRCYDPNCRSCCGGEDASATADASAPPPDGTCADNQDCPADNYCAGDTCGTAGRCVPRPMGCTSVSAPVCGCDGVTYINTCTAAAAGARIGASGECTGARDAAVDAAADARTDGAGGVCLGVLCSVGMACCDRPGSPAFGSCFDPACRTCCAPATGTDAGTVGPPDGAPGTCLTNADCASSWAFCSADGCGIRGLCVPRPTTCPSVVDPVCGCDGRTYANPCEASSTGVRTASRGPCAMPMPDGGVAADAPARSPCETVRCAVGYVCCDTPRSPSYGTCYDPRCTICCR